jgi:hypothetical protein
VDGKTIPLGIAAPPGQSWPVQVNDNFDKDNSINQAFWNGGTGAGMPPGFCGNGATSCGYTGKELSPSRYTGFQYAMRWQNLKDTLRKRKLIKTPSCKLRSCT